jgi:hypothetical protein
MNPLVPRRRARGYTNSFCPVFTRLNHESIGAARAFITADLPFRTLKPRLVHPSLADGERGGGGTRVEERKKRLGA